MMIMVMDNHLQTQMQLQSRFPYWFPVLRRWRVEESDGEWRLKMKYGSGFFSKNEEDARIVPVVWPFKGKGIFVISHPLNRENKLKLDPGTIREQKMKSWGLFR
ncbi:hypothetical protein HanRHA438_Chr07g0289811 [Helianthus annuus]|nr:hypothetical protein HanRHA438_Chr07g0289811 [Helianthus annuus]